MKIDKRKRRIIIIAVSLFLVFSALIYLLITLLIQMAPLCGNNKCDIIENWKICPEDCAIPPKEKAVCGDGKCEMPETATNCPVDCGIETTECGDGKCEMPETRINCPQDCEISAWIPDYKREMVAAGIPNNYLQATKEFDYYARNIQELIYEIRANSNSAEDAVKRTAREIYSRVDYVLLSGHDCMVTPASVVLEREYGLCSTMTKVNVAVLRGMGIAARPISGCAGIYGVCKPLSLLPGDPLPKFGKIRMEDGRWIVGGTLHAWLEAWLPDEGWVLVESTNGMVYEDPKCVRYDTRNINPALFYLCYSNDEDYVSSCKDNSLFD